MKKLFLRDGKLWVGEFPEEPFSYCGCEMCERHKQERFDESVESAKASAVGAVNPEAILTWDDREAWFFEHRAMAEDKLYDIPSGWKVDYEDVPLKLYKQKVVEKIARLIPTSESAQDDYSLPEHLVEPHFLLEHIRKSAENAQGETGIVATGGIPEAEQPEALAFLNEDDWTVQESGEKHQYSEGFEWLIKTNELITDASQTLFEDGGVTEEGICLITPHGNIALTVSELRRIIEEVSPPSQASEQIIDDTEMIEQDLHIYGIACEMREGKSVIRLDPRNIVVRRRSSQVESESREVWNEMLDYCTSHMVNDIRLLEYLMEHYILTRKTKP